jgi:hypothetical protein
VSSLLGFALDVLVYHTFSLWVRAVMKLLVSVYSAGKTVEVLPGLRGSGYCGRPRTLFSWQLYCVMTALPGLPNE